MSSEAIQCPYCRGWNMRTKRDFGEGSYFAMCLDCDACGPDCDTAELAREAISRVVSIVDLKATREFMEVVHSVVFGSAGSHVFDGEDIEVGSYFLTRRVKVDLARAALRELGMEPSA